jgi:hypothetical protein
LDQAGRDFKRSVQAFKRQLELAFPISAAATGIDSLILTRLWRIGNSRYSYVTLATQIHSTWIVRCTDLSLSAFSLRIKSFVPCTPAAPAHHCFLGWLALLLGCCASSHNIPRVRKRAPRPRRGAASVRCIWQRSREQDRKVQQTLLPRGTGGKNGRPCAPPVPCVAYGTTRSRHGVLLRQHTVRHCKFSNASVAHPLQNCRLYYSQIQMEPQHAITYNNANTNKKVIYRTFCYK